LRWVVQCLPAIGGAVVNRAVGDSICIHEGSDGLAVVVNAEECCVCSVGVVESDEIAVVFDEAMLGAGGIRIEARDGPLVIDSGGPGAARIARRDRAERVVGDVVSVAVESAPSVLIETNCDVAIVNSK
jgi:hypothetical protein